MTMQSLSLCVPGIRSHDKCDVEQSCHCLSPPSYAWFLQERWLEPGMEYVQQAGSSGSTGSGPAGAESAKSGHRQNYELGINRDFTVWLHGNTGMPCRTQTCRNANAAQ